MTTMTSTPQFGDIRTIDGVEHVFEQCQRCSGTGHFSYNPIDGTRCFDCRGRRGSWEEKGASERRAKRREAYARRVQEKANAEAAALPGKIAATIQAHPILADLLKLDDYSGFLGSLRSQLESKGTLSDRQAASATKILLERAERAAHAENDRRNRAATAPAGPIGEIGERREFTGKVIWFDYFLNRFSYSEKYDTVMLVATDEGVIKWKTSQNISLERGQQITFTATIKEHTADKQDRIVTVVTRGKLAK